MTRVLPPDDFWVMVVNNLIQENREFKFAQSKKTYYRSHNARDSQMAANLKWLCNVKYRGKKIIVWAHNYHVSKYNGHYPQDFLNKARTMGGVFTSDSVLRKETYIIGFSSYRGRAGRIGHPSYRVPRPKSNSFENWINKDYPFAFVDFKRYRVENPTDSEPFYMAGSILGNERHTNSKALWAKIFDGVFFIRNMYPCQEIDLNK